MSGFVYFIQSERGGPIKIGYTSSEPQKRLASLQTSSPQRLRIIGSCEGTRETECALHEQLAEHRLSGEWFRNCAEVRAAMREATGAAPPKPKARRRACGCVVGFWFCDDADNAWRAVGLARARGDMDEYTVALKTFGEHQQPERVPSIREDIAA